MKSLFLIDIRWVFLLGVFYLIWSRPTEQQPASIAPDLTPDSAISSNSSDKPMTMAMAAPVGTASKPRTSSRRNQNSPWPGDPEGRKYADVQDDPNNDPMNGGSSLSQGAVPVSAAVGSTSLVVIDNVYTPYRYYGYGYGAWRYRDFGSHTFGGLDGSHFGAHLGSSLSSTASLSAGVRSYWHNGFSSTSLRGSSVSVSPFSHSGGSSLSLSPASSWSHGSSLSRGSLSPGASIPHAHSHSGSTYGGGGMGRHSR